MFCTFRYRRLFLHSCLFLNDLFFLVLCKCNCFLISFSGTLLLVYRSAIDFHILILYFANLLNMFISFKQFSYRVSRAFIYKIILSTNRKNFTSSFPIWMFFLPFSCLIALFRPSSTVLNRCEHSSLVPNLKRKFFNFSSLGIMLAVGFSYVACVILKHFSSLFLES